MEKSKNNKTMPIPALIAAAGAVANGAMQFLTNSKQTRLAREMADRQERRQDYLTANSALFDRLAKAKAGYNPMADMGYPNVSAPTNSAPTLTSPQMDFTSVASLLQQAPLVKAQAEKTKAEADAQNILNERERSKDKGANKYMFDMLSDSSLFGDGFDNVVSADIAGPALPDTVKTGKGHKFNYGDFEFYKISKEFGNQVKEFDYNDAKWTLYKMIMKAQGEDKEILQSLVQLPKAQLSQIIQQTNLAIQQSKTSKSQGALFDAETALANLQKKLAEDNNMSQIFEGMLKDGLTVENVGKMLIACFVNFFKSSVSFSFSH